MLAHLKRDKSNNIVIDGGVEVLINFAEVQEIADALNFQQLQLTTWPPVGLRKTTKLRQMTIRELLRNQLKILLWLSTSTFIIHHSRNGNKLCILGLKTGKGDEC